MDLSQGKIKSLMEALKFAASDLPRLKLDPQDYQELRAEAATLGAQLSSNRPKPVIIEECLKTFERVLKSAGNAEAAAALLKKFQSSGH